MLEKGRGVELVLDSMAYGGDAVGRYAGQAVFVALGLPGERVRARVVEPHRSYARAVVEEVVEASPQRVAPRCSAFGLCGGCQWQMIDYSGQLEIKQQVLRETVLKLGGLDLPDLDVIGHPDGWGYRNKAQIPAAPGRRGPRLGYYQRGSHRLVEFESCPILDPLLTALWPEVRGAIRDSGWKGYDERNHQGQLRHLVLRSSRSQNRAMVSLVTRTAYLDDRSAEALAGLPHVSSLWQNVNPHPGNTILGRRWEKIWGQDYLYERLAGNELRLSPGSFLQVNIAVAEGIYRALCQALSLDGTETVVDVYSGVGSIALMLAGSAAKVVAIEENQTAVADAVASAEANGVNNCSFMSGRAEDLLSVIDSADVVVFDPPRQGLRPEAISQISRLKPDRIGYLSCNPATLARDLSRLVELGYRIDRAGMGDMFPQTYHIEVLVSLKRGRA